jgi:hypothetical protein
VSFDLFLNSFSRGLPSEANRDAVETFLSSTSASVEAGRIVGDDGAGNEIFGFVQWHEEGPWTGGAQFIVRSLNQNIVDFVYGFAQAGRLAICNPQFELPEPMWMLPPFVSADDLPPGDRQTQPVTHIKSGHELAESLVTDFTSFEAITKAVTELFGDES